MKKRILFLVLLVCFLCGCDATVNINISGEKVVEDITVTAFPDTVHYTTKEALLDAYRDYIPTLGSVPIVDTAPDQPVKGVSYYKKNVTAVGSGFNFNYKYDFLLNNYKNATSVKEGFKSFSIDRLKDEKAIRITTDSAGMIYFKNYPSLNNITVNITTDYEVKENNADSVNGNVYTWKFNKDSKKGIYLLLGEKETQKEEKKEEKKTTKSEKEKSIFDKHPVLFAVLGILVVFVAMWILSKLKK